MSHKNNAFYEFGDFRLDARAKILYHAGEPVALKPKVAETLVVLVENAGEVVGKTDLMNRVWQDSFVEENNLSVNIYALRKAFARYDGETEYIQTVPRRGFRFAAPLKSAGNTLAAVRGPLHFRADDVAEDERQTVRGKQFSADDELLTKGNGQSALSRENSTENNGRRATENEQRTTDNGQRTKPAPFSRRTLAAVVVVILCVAVGASLYAIRESRQQVGEMRNGATVWENGGQERRGTKNIEAYQLYLRGRELWQTRENHKMDEGIGFFRRAIELDPNFAAPYVGIADSLSMMRNDPAEWRAAEEYATKALELAPDSAEANATLGFIHAMNKWQWRAAENYFRQALALNPDCGKAHQWYATLLLIERRFSEAETHLKRAIEIEPNSPTYNADLCEFYWLAARDEEAFAQCRRAKEINPDFPYANERAIHVRRGHYDVAAEEWRRSLIRGGMPEDAVNNSAWYRAYKQGGFRAWMLSDIEREKSSPDALLGAWNTASAYAHLGDRAKTLENLEKTYEGRAFLLPFANVYRQYDFLRDDRQFQDLMRRVGLP